MRFCNGDDLFFQVLAGLAHLTKTACDNNRARNALFPAIFEDFGDGLSRRGNEDHFNRAFDFGNLSMARKPENAFFLWVHGIDSTLKTLIQQGLNGLVSPFGFLFGGTHHRNGRCVQHIFQTHKIISL